MKSKPIVAIVGRPNVGKSTFFNKICGKRISIVQNTPGVTRDRVYADADWCGYYFTLVDTGGIDMQASDNIAKHILAQAQTAISVADVVLFFVDCKEGVVAGDHDVANLLRASKKPVLLVVNKLDNYNNITQIYDFYELGLGEPIAISCEQSLGLGDLLDEVVSNLPSKTEESSENTLSIAVVGKPNAGKSSLINKLLGYDRVIVSDIAGTTRDSIDTPFSYNNRDYTLIDTAGMRRKRSIEEESIESYSVMRSIASIQRADIVLVLIDAVEGITEQDIKIAGYVHEQDKPSVIVINKWDAVEKDTFTIETYKKQLDSDLAFMDYYQAVYISALTGQRLDKLMSMIEYVHDNNSRRISTGVLNDIIGNAVSLNEPPTSNGRRLKIRYITQPDVCPPKFLIFCNDDTLVHFSYRRYIENSIRKAVDFLGTPIKIIFIGKEDDKI